MTDSHIIIAGQSNALGYLNDGPAPYIPTARVQIWTGTEWNYMNPGANTGTTANPHAWGPEVEIANKWLADHTDGYLWIEKTAKGSTGLAQDPNALDWSPHSDGEMFDTATTAADSARHNLDGTQFAFTHWDAAFWMQGETDATNATSAAHYGANLTEFLADARSEWDVTEFVVGRIGEAGAYSLDVRQAQRSVDQVDPDMSSVKTIGMEMQPDHLHYDMNGQLALGNAFYGAWVLT